MSASSTTSTHGVATPTAPTAPTPPKSQPTLLSEITQICAEAQASAFPGIAAKVSVAATERAGADYQNNSALQLYGIAKSTGADQTLALKSPRDVAERLAEAMALADKNGIIEKTEVAGAGFVNIKLGVEGLAARVLDIARHGALPPPALPRRVLVDFSSPNVAKEMHVGHLRSTILGDTLCRVLGFVGHEVERVNHVGDWGTQFGMLIRHLKNVFPDFGTKAPPIGDLQQFYRDSKQAFDEDESFKAQAHAEVVALQSGDSGSRVAWQQICQVSRDAFEQVYSRLGVELTEVGESFYNEYIPPVVAHLEQIGIATLSDGAKVIHCGTKHEQPLIVTKSDGGFGYDSTDMAAIWYRVLEKRCDWIVYVTDAGQGPHFELCFAAARKAGWATDKHRLDHCPFGLVQGSDGKKFKTRSGDVVRLVDLLDEAVAQMRAEMGRRMAEEAEAGKPVMSDEELDHAARVLGYGAVKYFDLKRNRMSDYQFSYEAMLDRRGNTAVYLLYAGARIAAITRKSGVDVEALAADASAVLKLDHPNELALGRHLLRFQDVIELAMRDLAPNYICDFVYELAEKFSTFYRECQVVGSPEQSSRLLICRATQMAMKRCFDLLGIGYLDRI